MNFFSFLIIFVGCTLEEGENPYEILGVKQNASSEEIKIAYHEITKKFHPDISKDEREHRMWMKATDAYEILSNPERRDLYDKYEIISEQNQPSKHSHYNFIPRVKRKGFSDFFFHGFNPNPVDYKTKIYTYNSLNELLNESDNCFIFYFSENEIKYTPDYGRAFEEVAEELSNFTIFRRISFEQGGHWFLQKYTLKITPLVAFFRKDKNDNIVLVGSIRTTDAYTLKEWVESFFPHHILILGDMEEAEQWVQMNPHITHVLSFGVEEKPGCQLRQVSCTYKKTIHFAYLRNETFLSHEKWNYTHFPTTLVFRAGKSVEIDNITNLDLYAPYYFTPFIWILMYREEEFFLYCGKDKPQNNFTKNIGIAKPLSFFSIILKLKEGEWYYIDSYNWTIDKVLPDGTLMNEPQHLLKIAGFLAALLSIGAMVSWKQVFLSIIIIWLGFIFMSVCSN